MTNKQRKTMIEQWVTQMNPKAILRAADARCGARYAVYVVPSPGEFGTRCTDYLPLEQLEQYLLGVFYANEFNKRMGRIVWFLPIRVKKPFEHSNDSKGFSLKHNNCQILYRFNFLSTIFNSHI